MIAARPPRRISRLVRRHPRRIELEAWFDGEHPESLGWHIGRCRRCFAHLERLSEIRCALQGVARSARGPDRGRVPMPSVPTATRAAHRRVLAIVVTVAVAGATVALGECPLHSALFVDAAARRPVVVALPADRVGRASPARASVHPLPRVPGDPPAAPRSPAAGGGVSPASRAPDAGAAKAGTPLHPGLVVPIGPEEVAGRRVAQAVGGAVAGVGASQEAWGSGFLGPARCPVPPVGGSLSEPCRRGAVPG